MTSSSNSARELAVRPFKILEERNLPAGYERSFKLNREHIYANRYLLGVEKNLVGLADLKSICIEMGVPDDYLFEIENLYPSANSILLGFEDSLTAQTYKLYLEFWDQARRNLKGLKQTEYQPQLLHRGYKWDCKDSTKSVVTDYQWLPNLDNEQILDGAINCYPAQDKINNPVREFIEKALLDCRAPELSYVEVSEAGNSRCSFDLNLYAQKLQVSDFNHEISSIAKCLHIADRKIARILELTQECALGHISGGTNRQNQSYFTVYYEPI